MESIPYHPIIRVTQEEMAAIRQSYDLDIKKINESLDVIEEWIKKEDHLVEALPHLKRDILERCLLLGRGSIERTKIVIDKILTARGMLPELFISPTEAGYNELRVFMDIGLLALLPKPNPKDNSRIVLVRLMKKDYDVINLIDLIRFTLFVHEIRMNYDYNFTHTLIFDCKDVKSNIIAKVNPIVLKKTDFMLTGVYRLKVKGIHIVNVQPFLGKLLSIVKQIIKEKTMNKIHIHSSHEELYEKIPREVLPEEYGGEEVSCSKLSEQWKDYFKTDEVKSFVENYGNIVSNESRRSHFRFNEEYLGMPGSFKQLHLD